MKRDKAAGSKPDKTRISIMIDNDVLESYKAKAEAQGGAYQTLMNKALREALDGGSEIEDRVRRLELIVKKVR